MSIRFGPQATEYRALADNLTEALAFVMEHLDEIGAEPMIHIEPAHYCEPGQCNPEDTSKFSVVVAGHWDLLEKAAEPTSGR